MKQFFITGSSSGIGKALALMALEAGHKVIGISRRNSIEHENYSHMSIDLNNMDSYLKINFDRNRAADSLILINNAGWLGEVKPVSELNPDKIKRSYHINLLAPSILCKMFIDQTQQSHQERIIVNISSGAGSYPIGSWSTYCAAKAGLSLFTEVMQVDHPDLHCFAISPGIVDTEMQGEIRRLDQNDFPDKQRFIDYKNKGELSQPSEVAQKILRIVNDVKLAPSTVFSLRDVS